MFLFSLVNMWSLIPLNVVVLLVVYTDVIFTYDITCCVLLTK